MAGWPSILHLNRGESRDLSLKWNNFGFNGIHLRVDPSTYCSGKFGYDRFKIELYILNTQGETVSSVARLRAFSFSAGPGPLHVTHHNTTRPPGRSMRR